jgi:hypothetical protein
MDSGAMIYIPSFINIGSGMQKIIEGDTHRQHGDLISLLLLLLNKESRLKLINGCLLLNILLVMVKQC